MGLRQKLWSNRLVRNITYILGTTLLLFFVIVICLRMYTHHGQKLILPDYVGMGYHEAVEMAKQNDFEMIISDSVHIVGKPGGQILAQNPLPESGVKEGRKIYLTVAKHNADVFLSGQLPALYGKRYDLEVEGLSTVFKLDCEVVGYKYDPGPKDHILEVRHDGKPIENKKGRSKRVKIARGDKIEFILSKRDGGSAEVPNLRCNTLEAAKFLATTSKMKIDKVTGSGEVTDAKSAYVIRQDPPADGRKISMGSTINVVISQSKPEDCN